MRHFSFLLVAIASVMSFTAFGTVDIAQFRCELGSKAKGGECRVAGFICTDPVRGCEKPARLRVRCNNGFRLNAVEATFDVVEGSLVVRGERDGLCATLGLEAFQGDGTYESSLVTVDADGDEAAFTGECTVKNPQDDAR